MEIILAPLTRITKALVIRALSAQENRRKRSAARNGEFVRAALLFHDLLAERDA
jgi:hypothetical protein